MAFAACLVAAIGGAVGWALASGALYRPLVGDHTVTVRDGTTTGSVPIRMVPPEAFSRLVLPSAVIMLAGLGGYVALVERRRLRVWLTPRLRHIGLGAAGGAGLLACGAAYDALVSRLGSGGFDYAGMIRASGPPSLVFLLAVVVAPAAEELYFRGRLHEMLEGRIGVARTVALTSCAFAVMHALPAYVPVYLVFGAVLAWLRVRSGGLVAPITAHALNNLVGLFVVTS